jgi:hypothetical protein
LRTLVFILISVIFLNPVTGQDFYDQIKMPKEPLTAKRNTALLFEGIGLNILGVAGMVGTVYLWIEYAEDEMYLLPTGTFTASFSLTVIGTGMIIKSTGNMIETRRSYHKMKKSGKPKEVSINIEPTRYGIGIVCKF